MYFFCTGYDAHLKQERILLKKYERQYLPENISLKAFTNVFFFNKICFQNVFFRIIDTFYISKLNNNRVGDALGLSL